MIDCWNRDPTGSEFIQSQSVKTGEWSILPCRIAIPVSFLSVLIRLGAKDNWKSAMEARLYRKILEYQHPLDEVFFIMKQKSDFVSGGPMEWKSYLLSKGWLVVSVITPLITYVSHPDVNNGNEVIIADAMRIQFGLF